MTRGRWLALVAVAGLGVFALSFIGGWLVQARELTGEGYRTLQIVLSGWRGHGMPWLTAAALMALAVAAWAVVLLAGVRRASWPLLVGSAAVLGLVLAAAWPVSQAGHASRVDLNPGTLLLAGAALAIAMLVGASAVSRPGRAATVALIGAMMVIVAGGAAGRWGLLQAAEGSGRHWSDGSYTRPATGGEPARTLTIRDGRFTIGDRWSGTWEWSGWTVVLDNDPACPDARGTYHAHGVAESALRFVKVVDICLDGARATDLETGTWERDP
jgi:hypothetical protein